jgi:methionyl-tRNA formyltransferase
MKIVVMGTGGFAVPSFKALVDSRHVVPALFTRPARPATGRRQPPVNPMREFAEAARIPVLAPESIDSPEAHHELKQLEPDVLVVCDYGQILASATLQLARYGGINLHASLLPKYRGAAPINWAIYHGESETGVTVIHMTRQLDGGPCLIQSKVAIGAGETAVELEERLAELGAEAVAQGLELLASGHGTSIGLPQDTAFVTQAPRLKKTDGQVSWSRTAQQINNQVRAFKPWPRSYTDLFRPDCKPIRLILDEVSVADDSPQNLKPGTIIDLHKNRLLVATGLGSLSLERIQPTGKRVLAIDEFLRGYPLNSDVFFGTVE